MNTLLYRPKERWRIWFALAGAITLHVGAVAFAKRDVAPATIQPGPPSVDAMIDDVIEPTSEPVPDDVVPPPPSDPQDFVEEEQTPAPSRLTTHQAKPLVRQTTAASPRGRSATAGRAFALTAPRPEYPYEARRQRLTGSGVATFTIDSSTGAVLEVAMLRSTGSALLDNAAISGLRRWRFKPGTPSKVQPPITFTLTGAEY